MIKIPGFRSGKMWKKILATFGYSMILLTVVSVANGGASNSKTSPVSAPVQQESKEITAPVDNTPIVAPIPVTDPIADTPIATPTTPVTAPVVTPAPIPKQTNQSTTVYGTRTGSKYHLDGCRSLSKSKIQMSLSDAKSSGLTACSICKPPQ